MVTQNIRSARPGGRPVTPDPFTRWIEVMETQFNALCGHLKTVFEKLDLLHDLLAGRRKDTFVVEEVAELTGRSEYTIRRWITEGKLKAIRISEGGPRGRLLIPRAELDRLVECGRGSKIPVLALEQEGKRSPTDLCEHTSSLARPRTSAD